MKPKVCDLFAHSILKVFSNNEAESRPLGHAGGEVREVAYVTVADNKVLHLCRYDEPVSFPSINVSDALRSCRSRARLPSGLIGTKESDLGFTRCCTHAILEHA